MTERLRLVVTWKDGTPSCVHIDNDATAAFNAYLKEVAKHEKEGKKAKVDRVEFWSRGKRRKRRVFNLPSSHSPTSEEPKSPKTKTAKEA